MAGNLCSQTTLCEVPHNVIVGPVVAVIPLGGGVGNYSVILQAPDNSRGRDDPLKDTAYLYIMGTMGALPQVSQMSDMASRKRAMAILKHFGMCLQKQMIPM